MASGLCDNDPGCLHLHGKHQIKGKVNWLVHMCLSSLPRGDLYLHSKYANGFLNEKTVALLMTHYNIEL